MNRNLKNKKRLFLGLVEARADLSPVEFIFYYGPTFDDSVSFPLDKAKDLLTHPRFDPSRKTVLYVHGYLESRRVESIHVIVDAYLKRSDVNIVVLDWGDLAEGNFLFDGVPNAQQLGSRVARILIELFDAGLNLSTFHLVGHSLGGQMSGIIGREVIRKSKKTKILPRISALDPAFPPFYFTLKKHISKHDAVFVDVIHTDAWLYGAPVSTGSVDFWPNGGATLQPGCPKRNYVLLSDNDLCSHRRSWWFWAESVSRTFPEQFNAVKAKSWSDFKAGRIVENTSGQTVYMGDNCPTDISGDYFLQTNGQIPWARGVNGTKYVKPSELVDSSANNNNSVQLDSSPTQNNAPKPITTIAD